ncbi:hypothetical protein GCM10027592_60250 [Spirosoma flavus]
MVLFYTILLLLLGICCYVSFWLLPAYANKTTANVSQNTSPQLVQADAVFMSSLDSLSHRLAVLESSPTIKPEQQQAVRRQIDLLSVTFPDSVHQAVLQSYYALLSQLAISRSKGDTELVKLDQQLGQLRLGVDQLKTKIAQKKLNVPSAQVARADQEPELVATEKTAAVNRSATSVVKAQNLGTFIPKLEKGSGYFESANPNIKFIIWFEVEANKLVLNINFSASVRPTTSTGIDSRVATQKVLFIAPPGSSIDPASVPSSDKWEYSYFDNSEEEETLTSEDGLLTCRLVGKSTQRVGDPGGTQLSVQLNRSIPVKLLR